MTAVLPRSRPVGAEVVERRFPAMNTEVHVVSIGGSPGLMRRAETMVHDFEARWSRFRADSELSRLNASAGRPVVVSPDTFRLIDDAIDAYHLTGGVFDPTVLTCLLEAGYDRSFESLDTGGDQGGPALTSAPAPTPAAVELLPGAQSIRLPAGVGLDLGGIAKGATADAVAEMLVAEGALGACVNVGGDLRVCGVGPDADAWGVALDCPGLDPTIEAPAVRLAGGGVCTSTILKRRWLHDGQPQHHLRAPSTGRPLSSGLVTATIVGRRAAQAEVLTKVVLAAGPAGAAVAAERWGVSGVAIDDAGRLLPLPGLDRFAARTVS